MRLVELCCVQSGFRWSPTSMAVTPLHPVVTDDSEGTATGGGPDDTTTEMVVPCLTDVPAAGISRSTSPTGTVIDERSLFTRMSRWWRRSAADAAVRLWPVTAGKRGLATSSFKASIP